MKRMNRKGELEGEEGKEIRRRRRKGELEGGKGKENQKEEKERRTSRRRSNGAL